MIQRKLTPGERRQRLHELHKRAAGIAQECADSRDRRMPKRIASGQIWTTAASHWSPSGTHPETPRTVLILATPRSATRSANRELTVAVIHGHSAMASDKDLILPDSLPLVGSSVVSFWLSGPFLARNLDGFIARLDKRLQAQCVKMLRFAQGQNVRDIHKLPIGPPLFSTADVRIEFQERLRQETDYLWQPALELRELEIARPSKESAASSIVQSVSPTILQIFDALFPALQPVVAEQHATYAVEEKRLSELRIMETDPTQRKERVLPLVSTGAVNAWITISGKNDLFLRLRLNAPPSAHAQSSIYIYDENKNLCWFARNVRFTGNETALELRTSYNLFRHPFHLVFLLNGSKLSFHVTFRPSQP